MNTIMLSIGKPLQIIGGSIVVAGFSLAGVIALQLADPKARAQEMPDLSSETALTAAENVGVTYSEAIEYVTRQIEAGMGIRPNRPRRALEGPQSCRWSSSEVAQLLGVGALVTLAGMRVHVALVLRRARREVQNIQQAMVQEVSQHIHGLEMAHHEQLREARAQAEGFSGAIHFPPALVVELEEDEDVPEWALCPISYELMTEPVCSPSGVSYQMPAIARWIEEKNEDPSTRQPLPLQHIIQTLSLIHISEPTRPY
eukprot:TRINITY_DN20208_c0_g1_i2.p1 TRINITY_DN20208_c0_g1~~TRINITY_DN20208_c0_g1_i2.p1  ORF type:complete len:257 (+),score=36.84 TRINITY_DN20208_c0_g1_i2:154-924(+)